MMQIYPDAEALAKASAQLFVAQAQQAVKDHGRFSIALSGGQTPRRTYELLAQAPLRSEIAWTKVHFFWGDERCVPPDDPKSNYRMTRETLLDHLSMAPDQIHRIQGEKDPHEAALSYEADIRQFFQGGPPRFDLVFLGLGDNGHTASLFPDTPVLDEKSRLVAEVYVAEQNMYRVTMTAPLLNEAALVAFVLGGANKTQVLREVQSGPYEPKRLPAQLIRPVNGKLLWLVDRLAAGNGAPR